MSTLPSIMKTMNCYQNLANIHCMVVATKVRYCFLLLLSHKLLSLLGDCSDCPARANLYQILWHWSAGALLTVHIDYKLLS